MLEGNSSLIVTSIMIIIIITIRQHPQGLNYVRERVKRGFFLNSNLNDDIKVKQAIAKGRYEVREIVALARLHKYRTLKKRYDPK